jgi:hypothetical protein
MARPKCVSVRNLFLDCDTIADAVRRLEDSLAELRGLEKAGYTLDQVLNDGDEIELVNARGRRRSRRGSPSSRWLSGRCGLTATCRTSPPERHRLGRLRRAVLGQERARPRDLPKSVR